MLTTPSGVQDSGTCQAGCQGMTEAQSLGVTALILWGTQFDAKPHLAGGAQGIFRE